MRIQNFSYETDFLVDFETAKQVIEKDLADTEFSDFVRITKEG